MRLGPLQPMLLCDSVLSCRLCLRRRARSGGRWARGGAGGAGRADGSPHVRAGRRSAGTGGGCCHSRGAPRGGSARVTRRPQSPRGRAGRLGARNPPFPFCHILQALAHRRVSRRTGTPLRQSCAWDRGRQPELPGEGSGPE